MNVCVCVWGGTLQSITPLNCSASLAPAFPPLSYLLALVHAVSSAQNAFLSYSMLCLPPTSPST